MAENSLMRLFNDLVSQLMKQFDSMLWGHFCRNCNRKAYCEDCPLK